jgi:hypothetical protein
VRGINFSEFVSKPVTEMPFEAKATARGIPTYPKPTTATEERLFNRSL